MLYTILNWLSTLTIIHENLMKSKNLFYQFKTVCIILAYLILFIFFVYAFVVSKQHEVFRLKKFYY